MVSSKNRSSLKRASWRQQIVVAFTLMAATPILMLGYIILSCISSGTIRKEVLLTLVTLNVALSVIGFCILKKNIKLLTHFREYVENISKGNLGYEFTIQSGLDITSMADSLKAIVQRLQKDRSRLKTLSNNQEKEIEQRTSALHESNMKLSRALTDLKEIQGHIIQQERLSALGQMASGIAHDFNNLLMPIVGLSEYILSNPTLLDDKEELISAIEDIHSAGDDAKKVVEKLKEFYKVRDNVELMSIDINNIIENTLSLTKPRWKEEMEAKGAIITINNEFSEIPEISANPVQLREALTNIVLNSIDAMPKGGTITCRTFKGKNTISIEISDTGTGMTSDVQKHCFEPFFSTKGTHGTGIGLAMTFGIIKRHCGTISVKSEENKGTTFTIAIPLSCHLQGEPEDTLVSDIDIGTLRVLVIDDDKAARNVLQKYLDAECHTIECAETGKKGIQAFSRKEFDLVITDRAMPDMSGDDVSAKIKEMRPSVPIIMLTGFGEIMKDNREIPAGVDTILGKPATQREIKHAIARAIHQTNPET